MKLPAIKNLSHAFLPTLCINFIFGIGVFEYPSGKPRPILSATLGMINIIFFLCFIELANIPGLTVLMGSKIAAQNCRMFMYFQIGFMIVVMSLSQSGSKRTRNSLRKLQDTNDRLLMFGISSDYKLILKDQLVRNSIALILVVTIIVLDLRYTALDIPSKFERENLLICAHHLLIFDYVIDSSYISGIRYFHNRFQRLNYHLEESDLQKNFDTQHNVESENLFPRHSSILNEIHGNLRSYKLADNKWLLHLIREMRKIHRDLCNMARELHKGSEILILISVTLSFCITVGLLYVSYCVAITSITFYDVMGGITCFLWAAFYSFKIFLIVDSCSKTSNEAMRTGVLIQELLDPMEIHNGNIRDEINIFTLQLLQNPLCFTANGFFVLDYQLIRGIIGSVTTFLVILIQMGSIYDRKTLDVADIQQK
ncbi:gustatory receptor 68a-like [Neodiprion pinetum]|uniref:gustatory receptor 68a-like n=1 Tax=Neodiprion pinetum TaxID=441929 RepID=UPI0037183B90